MKKSIAERITLLSFYSFKNNSHSSEIPSSISEEHKPVQEKPKTNTNSNKNRPDVETNSVIVENTPASNNKNEVPDGAIDHTKPSPPNGTTTVDKEKDFETAVLLERTRDVKEKSVTREEDIIVRDNNIFNLD